MRIAQISYHACPLSHQEGKETGGMQIYVLNLSRELARRGYQVDIFTRSENPDPKLKIIEIEKNLRLFHIPAGPEKTLPKKELIQFIPEFVKNLKKYIAHDIFHAHYYMSGLACLSLYNPSPPLSPLTPQAAPMVLSFHTLSLIKNLVARGGETEPQARIDAEMEIVKQADAVISPSQTEHDYLKYFYGADSKKIHVIPPGYDPAIFKPMDKIKARQKIGADPTHKIILFVGRIEPLKGIDVLMYALKILTERCNKCPVCLWIVGENQRLNIKNQNDILKIKNNFSNNEAIEQLNNGRSDSPEFRKLYQLQHTLNLHNFVKFIPQLPQSALPDFYNAADVVVMPSHYESFGMSALEAMACQIPVVTTNVTGISTMFDEDQNHFVSSANNPLMLASTIEKIIFGERRRPSARPWLIPTNKIADFTWAKTAEKMEDIYTSLLAWKMNQIEAKERPRENPASIP